eukprot:TRINITY_DN23836_c0_g1_i1.p1 TRINITY_DN23836_c0_g1~~TRINITY_DN23836_c0_g1_i1.p1  ORF type:complete len:680 (-),score=184.32 TRINITY_DN23836_c0_g1_i1:65-2044(-)
MCIRDRLERMKKDGDPHIAPTNKNLEKYGAIGSRTLLIAGRPIPEQEYNSWLKKYEDAITSMKDRDKLVMDAQELIEKDMIMIGATAIEDKLQDEVGLTIFKLKEAGIKVWVLTGDKMETAINIGLSCNLITKKTIRLPVEAKNEEEVVRQLDEQAAKLREYKKEAIGNSVSLDFCLVITGEALTHGLKPSISSKIMVIGEECSAVICCRVSPKQKADVVTLVRQAKPKVVTLAIGDGANDVNMITAAHVGIGIKGVEGHQAARASDFAIGEFKLLRRLLLYHGRESYRKNSRLICYNFYKNVLLVLPQFWFGFLNAFSGMQLYSPYLYQFFNIIFASGPIVVYAIFDSEYPDFELEREPLYYEQGIKHELFNFVSFWRWFSFGVWQAILIAYLCYYGLMEGFTNQEGGWIIDFATAGVMCFGACVTIANFKILIFSFSVTTLSAVLLFLSIAFYTLAFAVVNFLPTDDLYLTFDDLYESGSFYITHVLLIIATTFVDLAFERWFFLSRRKKVEMKIRRKQRELSRRKTELQGRGSMISNGVDSARARSYAMDRSFTTALLPQPLEVVNRIRKEEEEELQVVMLEQEEEETRLKKIPLFNDLLIHRGFAFSEMETNPADRVFGRKNFVPHYQNQRGSCWCCFILMPSCFFRLIKILSFQ